MSPKKKPPATLGERIKLRRQALQLTEAGLAEAAGLTQVAIHYYERGAREPNATRLRALATALGCSIDELVP